MKFLLIALLLGLVFGNGGRRVRDLFSTAKKLPDDFKRAKGQAEDPVGHAKEVRGRVDDTER
jgi:hypothetical protein